MDYKSFITTIGNYVNNKEYSQAINFLYNNTLIIDTIFKNYSKTMEINNLLDLSLKPTDEIILKFFNSFLSLDDENFFDYANLLRLFILKLIILNNKLTLNSKTELNNSDINVDYLILVGDTIFKQKLFILYILLFSLEAKLRKKYINNNKIVNIGLDFEFNARKIALIQINFESANLQENSPFNVIWIVDPNNFTKKMQHFIINNLMKNKNIHKILHGSDSLDIPYLYNILFNNNKAIIFKFTEKIFDTRFLCEYFKISIDEDKKCSIYEALLFFGTINEKKYKELYEIHESMGPVQDISWNINKLSSYHLKYVLYDVLFLQHFLYDIFKRIKKETPEYLYTYKYIFNLIRFVFIERREVTNIIEQSKNEINPMNNYLIKVDNNNITLTTIYNEIIENYEIKNGHNIKIWFILSVNYFKTTISILFKKIIYFLVTKNFMVFKNKQEETTEFYDLFDMYKQLEINNFIKIIKLLKLFELDAEKKLIQKYS